MKLWWIKRFGGLSSGGLTRIHCNNYIDYVISTVVNDTHVLYVIILYINYYSVYSMYIQY